MSQSQPRTLFSIHSLTAYNRTTSQPYGGELRVLQGSTFSFTGETVELRGGSLKVPWQVEDGDINSELSFSVSEYPNWLFELFGGKAPTVGTAEAAGYVSAITNKKGTSVVAATGVLAAITTGAAADLKAGKYVAVATTTTALKIYSMSDVDFSRGTAGSFTADDGGIGTLTIGTGAASPLANFGISLTGGASATAFVVGDSAEFEIRGINTFNRKVKLGGLTDVFPEFGAFLAAEKSGSGSVFMIDCFKCKNIGLTLGAERKAFSSNEYTAKLSYDSAKDGIAEITEVQ